MRTHKTRKYHIKRYVAFISLVLSISLISRAQDSQDMANQLIQIADEIYANTNAQIQARDAYLQVLDFDPDNLKANYMAGYLYLQTINKERAATYLLKVYQIDRDFTFDLFYQIGRAYHFGLDFGNAKIFYRRYIDLLSIEADYEGDDRIPLETVQRRLRECEIGEKLVASPLNYNITNAGENINSEWPDYGPSVNQDETIMIFTSRRKEGNMNVDVFEDNFPYEDIFISYKSEEEWGNAENISKNINTPFFESSLTMANDGKELYVYLDINHGDVLYSNMTEESSWSQPNPLLGEINTDAKETSVSLSPDGNTMFFASNRPGTLGGLDIFYAQKDKKGFWTGVTNIGSVINTSDNDDFPFIDFDGKTLYFSSRGQDGMGGYDIYKTVYDSSTGDWIKPVNIGYPINTPDDDISFITTQQGERGYFSSVREDGFGYQDIYMFSIPEEIQNITEEEPVFVLAVPTGKPTTINVHVMDENGSTIDANIQVRHKKQNYLLGIKQIMTGHYQAVITMGEPTDILISAERDGYIFVNRSFIIPVGEGPAPSYKYELILKRLQAGSTSIMRNVYFNFNKATLKKASYLEINKLYNMLVENSRLEIEIGGHTDKIGTKEYNQQLSYRRALAVVNALIKKGIDSARITPVGYGEIKPIASNDDEKDGRELNRRVEFKVK